jgi:hypothetical protein
MRAINFVKLAEPVRTPRPTPKTKEEVITYLNRFIPAINEYGKATRKQLQTLKDALSNDMITPEKAIAMAGPLMAADDPTDIMKKREEQMPIIWENVGKDFGFEQNVNPDEGNYVPPDITEADDPAQSIAETGLTEQLEKHPIGKPSIEPEPESQALQETDYSIGEPIVPKSQTRQLRYQQTAQKLENLKTAEDPAKGVPVTEEGIAQQKDALTKKLNIYQQLEDVLKSTKEIL